MAENVRSFRRKADLSQEDLAFETGLHRTYISGIERGVRNPTIANVEKIAIALDVNPSQLLEYKSQTK